MRMPNEREIQDCAENELVDCLDEDGRYLKSKRTKIVKYLTEKQKIDQRLREEYELNPQENTAQKLAAFHDELLDVFPDDDVMSIVAAVAPALVERSGLHTELRTELHS